MREKPIALLAFLVKFRDTFDNSGVYDGESGRVLACLLSDGVEELYEPHAAHGRNTDAHFYH